MNDNNYYRIQIEDPASRNKKKDIEATEKVKKPRAKRITKLEQIVCPVCKQGHIIAGRTAYGCSRFREGCELRLLYDQYDKSLTPSALNKLISKNFKDE